MGARKKQKSVAQSKDSLSVYSSDSSNSSSSSSATPKNRRKTAFGAVAAREMGSYGASYGSGSDTSYYRSSHSDDHKTFTMDDFDYLEDEDFDIFLEAVRAENDLTTFDNRHGTGSASTSTVQSTQPRSSKFKSAQQNSSKGRMSRRSSFTNELDDLLKDIM